MSTSPKEGLWVELTCDGNRRSKADEILTDEGVQIKPKDLNFDQAYACYKAGGEAAKAIVAESRDQMVGLIGLWIWSINNWERPKDQADAVFQVTREFLQDLKDNWIHLDENKDVRFVHMGRTERLTEEQPEIMQLMHELMDTTRERMGMVVALLMDYTGPDELERALEKWKAAGCVGEWKNYLDLPQQGVDFRELTLRIRTGETDELVHINAVMSAYAGVETREAFHPEMLPDYTVELYKKDLHALDITEKRNGK